jgi:uracil phosphoribosyltransferase
MKELFLTVLRDRNTSLEQYRQAANQLAQVLAAESGQFLPRTERVVKTPKGSAKGSYLSKEPALVPILRSGLILLPSFLHLYPKAPIGLIGIRRDHQTAKPHLYYDKIPELDGDIPVFLLDPMIATGGTAVLAVTLLKEAGIKETQIILISIIAAPEGLAYLKQSCPSVRTHIVHIDQALDAEKWIVPGLGDFGDRYFGTHDF